MRRLNNDELLHEFYTKYGNNYPDLNLEDFKNIVFSPWVSLREGMASGDLETFRLKYFGTFQVYQGRAKNMLYNLEERHRLHKIDREQYKRLKNMLTKFLKNNG